jgi:hypothetical protein
MPSRRHRVNARSCPRSAAGQKLLVLGATGTSSRIATQLARRQGARVVAPPLPPDRGPPLWPAPYCAACPRSWRTFGPRRLRSSAPNPTELSFRLWRPSACAARASPAPSHRPRRGAHRHPGCARRLKLARASRPTPGAARGPQRARAARAPLTRLGRCAVTRWTATLTPWTNRQDPCATSFACVAAERGAAGRLPEPARAGGWGRDRAGRGATRPGGALRHAHPDRGVRPRTARSPPPASVSHRRPGHCPCVGVVLRHQLAPPGTRRR